MARIRITGVVASTHPMETYGGVRLSKDVVISLAEKLRSGEIPFGLRHDPRVTLDVVIVDAVARQDDDGETLAEVTLEVDEEEYKQKGGMDVGGFSMSVRKPLIRAEGVEPHVTVSADAHWFLDSELQAAHDAFASQGIPAQANRLYQFADVPTALVIVHFVGQQIATMPTGVLCNYLYDSLKNFFSGTRRRQAASEQSDIAITFDPETGRLTKAHIRTSSDVVLKQAIDMLPDIIRSNINGAYEYSEDEQSWKQVE